MTSLASLSSLNGNSNNGNNRDDRHHHLRTSASIASQSVNSKLSLPDSFAGHSYGDNDDDDDGYGYDVDNEGYDDDYDDDEDDNGGDYNASYNSNNYGGNSTASSHRHNNGSTGNMSHASSSVATNNNYNTNNLTNGNSSILQSSITSDSLHQSIDSNYRPSVMNSDYDSSGMSNSYHSLNNQSQSQSHTNRSMDGSMGGGSVAGSSIAGSSMMSQSQSRNGNNIDSDYNNSSASNNYFNSSSNNNNNNNNNNSNNNFNRSNTGGSSSVRSNLSRRSEKSHRSTRSERSHRSGRSNMTGHSGMTGMSGNTGMTGRSHHLSAVEEDSIARSSASGTFADESSTSTASGMYSNFSANNSSIPTNSNNRNGNGNRNRNMNRGNSNQGNHNHNQGSNNHHGNNYYNSNNNNNNNNKNNNLSANNSVDMNMSVASTSTSIVSYNNNNNNNNINNSDDKSAAATSIVTSDYYSTTNDDDDDDDDDTNAGDDSSEHQLALRVAKEVKPMMHLLRFLKEMDSDRNANNNNNANGPNSNSPNSPNDSLTPFRNKPNLGTKEANVALASLISEFEEEVEMIEHRVQNQHLIENGGVGLAGMGNTLSTDYNKNNGGNEDEDALPPDWIELEDPESGDFYYANEITGETTWDRPKIGGNFSSTADVDESTFDETHTTSTGSRTTNTDTTGGTEPDDNAPLLPNWVAVEDPDSGDIYYANEVTGETTWDRPTASREMQKQGSSLSNDDDDNTYGDDGINENDGENDDDNDEEEEEEEDGSLPVGWTELEDPDSGDTYYVNEETGESTWDRPVKPKQKKENQAGNPSMQNNPNQQQQMNQYANNSTNSFDVDEDEDGDDDDPADDETGDDTLPPGWTAITDPTSGDTYYAHENGETTWDRPAMPAGQKKAAPQSAFEASLQSMNSENLGGEEKDGDGEGEEVNDNLPIGWLAVDDPDSGDTYYVNEATGETTWDRPAMPEGQSNAPQSLNASEHSANSSKNNDVDDNDENLPPGWLAVDDPNSGDTYYVNEATGETTWDRPAVPVQQKNAPQPLQTNQPAMNSASLGGDEDNDGKLPPGWLAVDDPASGDIYYVNEATGETTWDRPAMPPGTGKQNNNAPQAMNASQHSMNDNDDDDLLPPGWVSVDDPDSGDTYYVNEETGESTWDRPTLPNGNSNPNAMPQNGEDDYTNDEDDETGDDTSGRDDADLLPNWFSVVDKDSGDVYYANEVTGETSWERPVDPHAASKQSGGGGGPATSSNNDGLPPGWFAVADEASGDTYYVNEATGETTWDRPGGGAGNSGGGVGQGILNGMGRLSMGDDIVYEDRSETSSINF